MGAIDPKKLAAIRDALGEAGVAGAANLGPTAVSELLAGNKLITRLARAPRDIASKIPLLKRFVEARALPAGVDKAVVKRLSGIAGDPARKLMRGALLEKNIKNVGSPWWGTGIGAAVGMAPTLLNYWSRYSKGREFGGIRALRAHEQAQSLARKAEMLRRWREAQYAQLMTGNPQAIPFDQFMAQEGRVRFG
jgi:hypothetical protein